LRGKNANPRSRPTVRLPHSDLQNFSGYNKLH
jgi:hypothetical protein